MFNQVEIDSVDQLDWRNERKTLLSRVSRFCQLNNIGFTTKFSIEEVKKIPYTKIVMMWTYDLLPAKDHWQQVNAVCQKLGKICFVLTDNLIDLDDFDFVKFSSYPKLLGVTASYKSVEFSDVRPSKLFNCFIQRVDSVRQSWFYFLHEYNLIDQGYVSLLMKQLQDYSGLKDKELFDYIHYNFQLNQLPHFESAYQDRREQIPFRNFVEENNLLPLILDSKYSLVLETYAIKDDVQQWCFTEKSLRAIQFPVVSLLFVQKHGIQKLQHLGFEIGNHMNELDQKPWQERQQELLNILVNNTLDIPQQELYNQSKHNQNLLESWKIEYQQPNYFDNFYNKVLEN